ncbi:MAG TPA: hypothetical protein VJ717_03080 [Gemmatimonadaceae bacterium]|nr:hypothetical protein [Gemmatimonadaceae bacterium]
MPSNVLGFQEFFNKDVGEFCNEGQARGTAALASLARSFPSMRA